jgi:hypothetical protein
MLPELIQREMTGPDRAFLIHRLLTDTVGWPDVAASWSHAEAAATAAVETILSDEYGEPLEGDVRRGLDELRAALADAPAARGGANIRIGGMDLTAADVKMEKRYPLPGQTGRIPLSLLTA